MDLSIVPHNKMQQLMRSDRHMFATSDDLGMLKQVEATHVPDGRQFAVKPLLHIIEDIFQRAAPSVPGFVEVYINQVCRSFFHIYILLNIRYVYVLSMVLLISTTMTM